MKLRRARTIKIDKKPKGYPFQKGRNLGQTILACIIMDRGGYAKVADGLGVSRSSPYKWVERSYVPDDMILKASNFLKAHPILLYFPTLHFPINVMQTIKDCNFRPAWEEKLLQLIERNI